MNAVNRLLDKARERCSLASDIALAEKIDVSRQLVSQWRKGDNPISDERIAQLAKLAHVDGGEWQIRVHAEQDRGEAAKNWRSLLQRLPGIAATMVIASAIVIGTLPSIAHANESRLSIMRSLALIIALVIAIAFYLWNDRRSLLNRSGIL